MDATAAAVIHVNIAEKNVTAVLFVDAQIDLSVAAVMSANAQVKQLNKEGIEHRALIMNRH